MTGGVWASSLTGRSDKRSWRRRAYRATSKDTVSGHVYDMATGLLATVTKRFNPGS